MVIKNFLKMELFSYTLSLMIINRKAKENEDQAEESERNSLAYYGWREVP